MVKKYAWEKRYGERGDRKIRLTEHQAAKAAANWSLATVSAKIHPGAWGDMLAGIAAEQTGRSTPSEVRAAWGIPELCQSHGRSMPCTHESHT